VKTDNKLIKFRKKNSELPDNLSIELHDKFRSDNIDCQHLGYHPCVFRKIPQEVYERCCPVVEKNIPVKGSCNKWYNTEIKRAKRNLRRAEKKYRRNKNEEGRRISVYPFLGLNLDQ